MLEGAKYLASMMSVIATPAMNFSQHVVEIMVAHRAEGWIHKLLRPQPGKTDLDSIHRRPDLILGLFLSSAARTEYMPPRDWSNGPPDIDLGNGFKTYRHEFEVLRSIAYFFNGELKSWNEKTQPWSPHLKCSRVMLGSGSSNKASAQVIGSPASPLFCTQVGRRPVTLTYSIGMGNGVVKRRQYGKQIVRSAHAIYSGQDRCLVQADRTDSGRLRDDYLLVTRVPGPIKGTVFTVLSGLHGPGTRSAQLLLDRVSTTDLEVLADRVDYKPGGLPYFQAIFRASGLESVKSEGSVVPTKIELVMDRNCQPVPIKL